jgi:HlyD family secretion protein
MTHFQNPFKLTPTATSLIAVCVITAGAIGLFGSKSWAADDKPAAQPKAALTVAIAQPQQGQLGVRLAANGNIAAWQEASIGSEAVGLRLSDVRVNVGDVVRAGQVLASFAAESVQADVAQAKASLMEAQATAQDAAGNAQRARTLQESAALSAQQINQYLTAEQTALARVESAKAMLAVQQQRLKQTQVLAPDSGIISARSATLGAVPGGGTELFRLIRQSRLEWRAEVTAAELGQIKPGTLATLTATNGAQIKGKVRMVAPTVDPQTRAALVYVDVPPQAAAANAVKAGMFARGEFELGQTAALTVPQSAVVVRDGFSYVYRVTADSKINQLKVQTGRVVGEQVEVQSGVKPEDRIVIVGGSFLAEGDLVKVVGTSQAKQTVAPANAASAASK